MKFTPAFLLSAFILTGLAAAPAAQAQTAFGMPQDGRAGAQGDTIQFADTLSNSSATDTVFLNNDTVTFTAPGLTLTDLFFSNGPASLGPVGSGTETYNGDFFDVAISSTAQPGTYSGTFEIQGGADSNADGIVAAKDFSVTVLPAAVPEVSSFFSLGLLLALSLGGVAVAARRKAL